VLALIGTIFLTFLPFVYVGNNHFAQAEGILYEKEPNNSTSNANSFKLLDNIMGKLTKGDVDCFKLSVTTSGSLETFAAYRDEVDFKLEIYDEKENLLEPINTFEGDEGTSIFSSYVITPGTYYFRVSDKPNFSKETVYTFMADVFDDSEPVVDNTPPVQPKVNVVDDNDNAITGKGEPGSYAVAQFNSYIYSVDILVSKNGNFTIPIDVQTAGTSIKVWLTDEAGNESQPTTIKVVDKTPPKTLVINTITSKSKTVNGKTEPKALVEVRFGNKLLGKATADSKGNYKVTIKPQKKGSKLTVSATDNSKNKKVGMILVK
jgi:hypothetical protein